jgi:hypothetical protein
LTPVADDPQAGLPVPDPQPRVTLDALADTFEALQGLQRSGAPGAAVHSLLEPLLVQRHADDAAWALFLLEGARLPWAWSPDGLRRLACERAAIGDALFDDCLRASGDFAEVVAQLVVGQAGAHAPGGLAGWFGCWLPRHSAQPQADALAELASALAGLGPAARWLLVKAVSGAALPRALGRRELQRALAACTQRDPALLALRWPAWRQAMRAVPGVARARAAARRAPAAAARSAAGALSTLLAAPTAVEQALLPLPFAAAGAGPAAVPAAHGWRGRWCYGGVDAQLLRAGGRVALWTASGLCDSAAHRPLIDAMRKEVGDLQLRGELLEAAAARGAGWGDGRTGVLVVHAGPTPPNWPAGPAGPLLLQPDFELPSVQDDALAALWACARPAGATGLRLRPLAAPGAGDAGAAAAQEWAWHPPPLRLHGIVQYLQPAAADGGECTVAVWSRPPAGAQEVAAVADAILARQAPRDGALHLVPVARFTLASADPLWASLQEAGRAWRAGRIGPVQLLRPALCVELACDALHPNARRRSGIRLAGARLLRLLPDSAVLQAASLCELQALRDEALTPSAGGASRPPGR